MHSQRLLMLTTSIAGLLLVQTLQANSLTPPLEPKDDSFYICYEKRCRNNVMVSSPPIFIIPAFKYTKYKYIGCIISRIPCELIEGDKFVAEHPWRYIQFSWANNYPQALNAFYRCAYS